MKLSGMEGTLDCKFVFGNIYLGCLNYQCPTFQPIILMGYFVFHHWGRTSIFRALSYPLRSLIIKICMAEKLISNVISWCVTPVIQKDSEIGNWKIKYFSTIHFTIKK